MTTEPTSRDEILWSLIDCLEDARLCAESGLPWTDNPHDPSTRLWHVWSREWNRTIQRLVDEAACRHEAELAERCEKDGEKCGAQSFWSKISTLLFGESE